MNKNRSLVNKIFLLSLPALLFGTANNLNYSLVFSLSLVFVAIILKLLNALTSNFLIKKSNRYLLWGIGLGLSYFIYLFMNNYLLYNLEYYFILIGATPIIYTELEKNSKRNFIINYAVFLDLILATSILRELLGKGSILNYQFFSVPPLEIASTSAGAFMILALVAFIYDFIISKFKLKNKLSYNIDSSEVQS